MKKHWICLLIFILLQSVCYVGNARAFSDSLRLERLNAFLNDLASDEKENVQIRNYIYTDNESDYLSEKLDNGGRSFFIDRSSEAFKQAVETLSKFNENSAEKIFVFTGRYYLPSRFISDPDMDLAKLRELAGRPSVTRETFDALAEQYLQQLNGNAAFADKKKIVLFGFEFVLSGPGNTGPDVSVSNITYLAIDNRLVDEEGVPWQVNLSIDEDVFRSSQDLAADWLFPNIRGIIRDIEIYTSPDPNRKFLSAQFLKGINATKYYDNPAKKELILAIADELDQMNPVLDQDYGVVKVSELSPIQRLFYVRNQQITEANLFRYLEYLKSAQAGTQEINEKLSSIHSDSVETLRGYSRMMPLVHIEGLTWENRERLLRAWSLEENLTQNYFSHWNPEKGYDEQHVIELIARTPRKDATKLLSLFRENNCEILLKFYKDLNDWGGPDNNSKFMEELLRAVNASLEKEFSGLTDTQKWDKLFSLQSSGQIRYIFINQTNKPRGYNYDNIIYEFESNVLYSLTNKYCKCWSKGNSRSGPHCIGGNLFIHEEVPISALDYVAIVDVDHFAALDPAYFNTGTFKIQVVPGLYFRYEAKEANVKLAENIAIAGLTVISFVVPGTQLVLALQARNYFQIIYSSVELMMALGSELTASPGIIKALQSSRMNAQAVQSVFMAFGLVHGRLNGLQSTTRSMLDEVATISSRELSNENLRAFMQFSDYVEENRASLTTLADTDVEKLRQLRSYLDEELARTGRVLDRGEEVVRGGAKWFDDLPSGLRTDIGEVDSDLGKLFASATDAERTGLVDAWKVIEGNPILRKKPQNLANISKWLDEGVEHQKLTDGIAKSRSKQNLIDELGTAESKLHARVLIKDYDNIPGVVKGRYVPNGSTLTDKIQMPLEWPSDVDIPVVFLDRFTGKIEPFELKSGDKIYRVSSQGGAGGAYWTRTKPQGIEDVIGGTAVQPKWNDLEYLYEYTVPQGKSIKTWKGSTARQPVGDVPSNYHLEGGEEQLFVSYIEKQDPGFLNIVKVNKTNWLTQD